jgi:hypothetical protein
LEPGAVEDLAREADARVLDGRRLTGAEPLLPFEPISSGLFLVQGAEQRIVVEPPPLAFHEVEKGDGPRRSRAPLVALKAIERGAQRPPLDLPDRLVGHPRRETGLPERRTIDVGKPRFPTGCDEFLHVGDRDVYRIDRHRAHRRIG